MLSASLVREMLACAIALQAYSLIIRKKKLWFAVVILIVAYSIHNSAIITFLWIPLLLLRPKNKTASFSLTMVGALFLPFLTISMQGIITSFFPDYSLYYIKNYYQNSFGIGTILMLTYEVFIIWYMYRKNLTFQILIKLH